jgi:hypothetical protein
MLIALICARYKQIATTKYCLDLLKQGLLTRNDFKLAEILTEDDLTLLIHGRGLSFDSSIHRIMLKLDLNGQKYGEQNNFEVAFLRPVSQQISTNLSSPSRLPAKWSAAEKKRGKLDTYPRDFIMQRNIEQ